MMLKNPKLLRLLRSPDDPEGGPLIQMGKFLMGASWTIPIVDGIPDFVTYAPPTKRSLEFDIPLMDNPSLELLKPPAIWEESPKWFKEEKYKYPLLKDHRKGLLLDAGCGQGNRSTFEKLGYDYIGLDISLSSEQRCLGPSDLDIVADCHRLPLPSGSIEVINSTAVLEHLYFPPLAVQEFNRILKSGGLLVGSCSFLEGEHFESQHHYSYLGLYTLLKYAGFDVRHIYPGLSMWEMHSSSIYFGVPGNQWLGKLHRKIYMKLVNIKSKESSQMRLLRHAAVLNFVALKY